MIAIRRSFAALAVLATITTGAPTPNIAPVASALTTQHSHSHSSFRASRSEIRVPLRKAETQKVLSAADIQPVKAGPLLHDKPAPKPKHKVKPYNPFTDAPHTQAGAEQFAASLPWPWPRIVHCESLRDQSWRVSAKSWARGLFQFLPSTWRSLGLSGDPAAASWRVQYRAALKLERQDGSRVAWDCARMLGVA